MYLVMGTINPYHLIYISMDNLNYILCPFICISICFLSLVAEIISKIVAALNEIELFTQMSCSVLTDLHSVYRLFQFFVVCPFD